MGSGEPMYQWPGLHNEPPPQCQTKPTQTSVTPIGFNGPDCVPRPLAQP